MWRSSAIYALAVGTVGALALAPSMMMTAPLASRVAVVTGASRGIGKGVALELGASGMTVYCVARSSRDGALSSDRAVSADAGELTVEATAEEVRALGGVGVAVSCDCGDAAAMEALVARVRADHGRLDVLVCSAFGTPPKLNDASFRDDFWKQGMAMWDTCHGVGLRTRTPRLERRARAHSFSREGKPPVHPPWKR